MTVQARLRELSLQYGLAPEGEAALAAFVALVSAAETAPTAVRAPAVAVDVHVADALSGLELAAVRDARAIADLGAGAGVPGLILAAALAEADVALVESVGRKCAFLDQAVAAMELANARVVCSRAEEWREGIGACDLVTARALAPLTALCEYAAPLLRLGGSLVAWKGGRDTAEEADGAAAATELGLDLVEIRRVSPFAAAERRHLYLYSKVRETPERYPRRAGMARKRPIVAST